MPHNNNKNNNNNSDPHASADRKNKGPPNSAPASSEAKHNRNDNNKDNNKNKNESTDAAPSPFLGRELRVELSDRRVLVGTLIAFMGTGDLLLQSAVEERRYADGEKSVRPLSLVAVPFKHVAAMHRRLPGHEPIALKEGY